MFDRTASDRVLDVFTVLECLNKVNYNTLAGSVTIANKVSGRGPSSLSCPGIKMLDKIAENVLKCSAKGVPMEKELLSMIELCHQSNLKPKKVAATRGGEYASPCPACGGEDRFRIWPKDVKKNCTGSYWCRHCGANGDSIQYCIEFLGMRYPDAVACVGGNLSDRTDSFFPPRPKDLLRIYKPASVRWMTKAEHLVRWAHQKILTNDRILQLLARRGLDLDAVRKFWLGFIPKDFVDSKAAWGLVADCEDMGKTDAFFPAGIVIPNIEEGKIVRLKIRRNTWTQESGYGKYFYVPGSSTGMCHYGDRSSNVVIVFESELDAMAVSSAMPAIMTIATGSSSAHPDCSTDYYARRATHLLIAHDSDPAGVGMWLKWSSSYPKAKALGVRGAKDVGEAIEQGLNVKNWAEERLQKEG